MSVHDYEVRTIDGEPRKLADYRGKTLLIVNVASECGFTPQYAGLQALYERFRERGLEILGFPCNQFGHQEPGEAVQIKQFCTRNYGVSFPMFAKIDVNGSDAHPLYEYLKREQPGVLGTRAIKWNFTKFLVDGEGRVIKRYAPRDTPEHIGEELAARLNAA